MGTFSAFFCARVVSVMPKSRDKSYCRSYRKVRSNVACHISSVYNVENCSDYCAHEIDDVGLMGAVASEENELNIPSHEQSRFTWSDSEINNDISEF